MEFKYCCKCMDRTLHEVETSVEDRHDRKVIVEYLNCRSCGSRTFKGLKQI